MEMTQSSGFACIHLPPFLGRKVGWMSDGLLVFAGISGLAGPNFLKCSLQLRGPKWTGESRRPAVSHSLYQGERETGRGPKEGTQGARSPSGACTVQELDALQQMCISGKPQGSALYDMITIHVDMVPGQGCHLFP